MEPSTLRRFGRAGHRATSVGPEALMDITAQRALIERIDAHRAAGRGTDVAEAVMEVSVTAYTDPTRLDAERCLIADAPAIAGLSGRAPGPRSCATADIGDHSVIVTRDDDGAVHAMLNVCRHRGAEVVSGCGSSARLACPYHGWVYGLDGTGVSRRRNEHFDGGPEPLTRLPVAELDGIIWVSADPDGSIPDRPLHGAEAELAPLGLGDLRLFGTRSFTRRLNWKLAIDTFCEAYHLSTLHRTTLAPLIHDDFAVFDPFGPHGRMVAIRKSFDTIERGDDRLLLPHATILWFLVPNTVLLHQQDHVQIYQSRPGRTPDEAHLSVSLYVPPGSNRPDSYWQKNFDLLVDVTDSEDFATAAGIQRGFRTRAQDRVVFGRNEPALQHFHRSLDSVLDGALDP
ncbi:MAG: aromatic ring-hydroxylating oxygenase subunit alpha [Ilumatobacteraceae bacterium]